MILGLLNSFMNDLGLSSPLPSNCPTIETKLVFSTHLVGVHLIADLHVSDPRQTEVWVTLLVKLSPASPNLKSITGILASPPHSPSLDRHLPSSIGGCLSTREPSPGDQLSPSWESMWGYRKWESDLECALFIHWETWAVTVTGRN